MRKLRVAFVMGGGVSLGTFSGGALGEVVRILSRWADRPGKSVEIDVCAGASAGALSLAMMLRTLSHPGTARETLVSPAPPLDRLVKEVQRYAWVDEVSLHKLAGAPPPGGLWKSLLDRAPLERVSKRLLAWPVGQAHKRQLLASRVLFHNTLSNLNGVPFDARPGWHANTVPGTSHALADALWTGAFKDRRVFDLRFPDAEIGPPRVPHVYPARVENPATWEEMAGTAVACSAFPMAFEPVVLRRLRSEYPRQRRQVFGDDDERLFTYSDGGVFDNDPMGDALELCRKLDTAQPFGPGEARLIVYIDPNVGRAETDPSLALHQDITLKDDRAKKTGYLDRALGQGGRLATAVLGQVHHKDEAKIAFDPATHGRYTILGVGTLDPDAPAPPGGAAAEPERLWGAAGANFAGFLDRRYREHDFAVGELHAFRGMKRFFAEVLEENIPVQSPTGPRRGKRPDQPEDVGVLRARIKRALDDAIPIPTAILSLVVPLLTPIYRTLVTHAAAAAMIDQDDDDLPSVLVPLRLELTGLPRRAYFYHHLDGDQRHSLKVDRRTDSIVLDTILRVRQRPGARFEWDGPGLVGQGGRAYIKILFRRRKQGSRPTGRVKDWCGFRITGLDWALARQLDGMGKGVLEGRATWKSKKKVRIDFDAPRDELEAWRFPED